MGTSNHEQWNMALCDRSLSLSVVLFSFAWDRTLCLFLAEDKDACVLMSTPMNKVWPITGLRLFLLSPT